MIALLIAGMFVLGGATTAGVGYWRYARANATTTATTTATGVVPTVNLTADDADAALAPLHGPVGTGTAGGFGPARAPRVDAGAVGTTSAPGMTATATATATAPTTTATAPASAKACKAKCLKGCEGDQDEDGCLRECFLECPP